MPTSIYNKEFPSWLEWHADTGLEEKEPQQYLESPRAGHFLVTKMLNFTGLSLGEVKASNSLKYLNLTSGTEPILL